MTETVHAAVFCVLVVVLFALLLTVPWFVDSVALFTNP
jgi:hypothetical protein